MSPTSLVQLSNNINATIGIEFEMYVPNVPVPDDGDFELLDYPDQGFNSIDETPLMKFFHESGMTNPMRRVKTVAQKIETEFSEYLQTAIAEELEGNEINDFISDKFYDKYYSKYEQAAIDQLESEGDDISDQDIYDLTDELLQDAVLNLQNEDEFLFNQYYDEFMNELVSKRKNDTGLQKEFLKYKNYNTMRGISEKFGLEWPKFVDTSGMKIIHNLRDNFAKFVDENVRITPQYKGITDYNSWVIQIDGSLISPNNNDDGGWEFVSPKLQLHDMHKVLRQIQQFAYQYKCYTNQSCGLHINLSINDNMHNLDYMKLVLLLGDNYILDQFARGLNHNCKSVLNDIQKNFKRYNEYIDGSLDKLKTGLEEYSRDLYATNRSRGMSVNASNPGRIEFRSPGGDWLGILNTNPDKITNTILRMAVALDAATDKTKYRNEYIKKFYKLIKSTSDKEDVDILRDFVLYVTGEISKQTLKARLLTKGLIRQYNKGMENRINRITNNQ